MERTDDTAQLREALRETVIYEKDGKRIKRLRNPNGPAAADRIEALESELERINTDDIHSCGDHCQRVMCVQRRRIEALEALARRMVEWHRRVDDIEDDLEYLNRGDGWSEMASMADAARALLEGERADG